MSITVFNPTNEDFPLVYEGITQIIHGRCKEYPEGEALMMDEAKANFLVNRFGRRGLTTLEFKDGTDPAEKEKKIKHALAANKAFKIALVERHNQINEDRRQARQPLNKPTAEVTKYSEEFGIEILSPYTVKTEQGVELAELREANAAQAKQISGMMSKMMELMNALQERGGPIPEKTEEEQEHDRLKGKYKRLSKKNLKEWVDSSKEEILAFPTDVRFDLVKKYEEDLKEPFPYQV